MIQAINYEIEKIKKGKETRPKNSLIIGKKIPEYDFAYMVLPRAQAHPKENNPIGFCHLHNIFNCPINKKWIEEKIDKNNYKIGFTFIRKNKSVAEYLCNDFFDDDEWIIPYGMKHYHTSRNVIINMTQGYMMEQGMKYYQNRDIGFIENDLNSQNIIYEIFGETIKTKSSNILPFEEYLKQFSQIEYRDKFTSYQYSGNGHSHVRASLMGPSITLPIKNGELLHGTWQQVVFVELDTSPHNRNLVVEIIGE